MSEGEAEDGRRGQHGNAPNFVVGAPGRRCGEASGSQHCYSIMTWRCERCRNSDRGGANRSRDPVKRGMKGRNPPKWAAHPGTRQCPASDSACTSSSDLLRSTVTRNLRFSGCQGCRLMGWLQGLDPSTIPPITQPPPSPWVCYNQSGDVNSL